MEWFAKAPSNIALIKYMGKKDAELNLPMNSSLSYTLNHLISRVMIEKISGKKDFWEPLDTPGSLNFNLSIDAQNRFLNHLALLKSMADYTGAFVVRSCNNFPHSSGLASSASSFAALTKCALLALHDLTKAPIPSIEIQAQLSRQGSGSSCRSFFSPWALWQEESVKEIDLPYKDLLHQVIVISHEPKKISSGEAHKRISTSKLYPTRSARAENNFKILLEKFQSNDWAGAYHVCWREFQDMHSLFSTCEEPFSYINEQSQTVLNELQNLWQREGDGPLITMDAGPNIHVLYRQDQSEMARKFKSDYLIGNYDVI